MSASWLVERIAGDYRHRHVMIEALSAKIGENVVISRFSVFRIGE